MVTPLNFPLSPLPDIHTKIVFASNRGGNYEIIMMNADGTGQTRLTANSVIDYRPVLSNDGSKIVYEHDNEIYVMKANGTGTSTRLTNNSFEDTSPTWSPDGSKIAFVSNRDGNSEIYTMNEDGKSQVRFTNHTGIDDQPAWSPDGLKIAFASNRSGTWSIYIATVDGVETPGSLSPGQYPSWSRDGSKIAFMAPNTYYNDIYVMNADGTGKTILAHHDYEDRHPAWSPDGSKITFSSNRANFYNYEIYVMDADGANVTPLTNAPENDEVPFWGLVPTGGISGSITDAVSGSDISEATITVNPGNYSAVSDGSGNYILPGLIAGSGYTVTARASNHIPWIQYDVTITNGVVTPLNYPLSPLPDIYTKIVFASNRGGNYEIIMMNADGTGQTRLTTNSVIDYRPVFSPDGSQIVFEHDNEIYVMKANGTGTPTQLTNNSFEDTSPTWSPDGSKIAFVSNRDGNSEIYTMDEDGTNQVRFTNHTGIDDQPAWSPDGLKIAFASNRSGTWSIYIATVDGAETSGSLSPGQYPAWSPDGSKITFMAPNTYYNDIYVMNADGTDKTVLAHHDYEDRHPAWSPDGSKITFSSNRANFYNYEIYVMDADGANVTPLTNAHENDEVPSWGLKLEYVSKSVAEAVLAGWIDGHAYVYDAVSKDYHLVEADELTEIHPWQGFWVGVNGTCDIVIPRGATVPSTVFQIEDNAWRFMTCPIIPDGSRDLDDVFSPHLGVNETDWRAVKWDYTSTGSGTSGVSNISSDACWRGIPRITARQGILAQADQWENNFRSHFRNNGRWRAGRL